MRKSSEYLNKAILQMAIDGDNGKCQFYWGETENNGGLYKIFTDGYVLYILPAIECFITPHDKHKKENIGRLLPEEIKGEQIDVNTIVSRNVAGKMVKGYKTNDEKIIVNVKLLKGFGNNFKIHYTESKYMFAVEIGGNIRGVVMGARV